MNKMIRLLLFALLPAATLAESFEAPDEVANYDYWYRVEIVIFKQKRPLPSDEFWPLEDIRYPHNMVAVAPYSDSLITPYSLSQVEDLYRTDGFTGRDAGGQSANGFLFKDFMFGDQTNINRNRQLLQSVSRADANFAGRRGNDTSPGSLQYDSTPNSGREIPDISFVMADALLDSTLPQAFRSLKKDAYTLTDVAGSLQRSSKYELLKHQAWLQPIDATPTPILIQTGDRYDDLFEIDGTLAFSRSRFLHLDANLWFTQFIPLHDSSGDRQQMMQNQGRTFSDKARNYPDLVELERHRGTHMAFHTSPLRHSRRMRSSEMHFIDHPFFGVLVKIDKFTYTIEDRID